jgi:hypothetical protein
MFNKYGMPNRNRTSRVQEPSQKAIPTRSKLQGRIYDPMICTGHPFFIIGVLSIKSLVQPVLQICRLTCPLYLCQCKVGFFSLYADNCSLFSPLTPSIHFIIELWRDWFLRDARSDAFFPNTGKSARDFEILPSSSCSIYQHFVVRVLKNLGMHLTD